MTIDYTEEDIERFWAKVDKNGPIAAGLPGRCWLWTGSFANENGYGSFRVHGRNVRAHRFAYEATVGPIQAGLVLMHKCDNPPCCNPQHTRPGTNRENMLDAKAKGRLSSGARHSETMQRVCARGERNGSARLTRALADEIRRLSAGGATQRPLAKQFGVDHTTISKIVRNLSWK